jgi:hypothetical protein
VGLGVAAQGKPKVIPVDDFIRDELYPGYTQAFGTQPFVAGPVRPFSKADNASYWLRDSLHFSEEMVPASIALLDDAQTWGAQLGAEIVGVPPTRRSINRLAGTHVYIGTIDVDTDWQIQTRDARFGQYVGPILQDFDRYWGIRAGELQSAHDSSPVYRNRRDCAEALVPAIRRDIQDPVAAGCDYIQIGEPLTPSHVSEDRTAENLVDLVNKVVDGVSGCTFVVHICLARSAACRTPSAPTAGFSRHCSTPTCTGFSLEFGAREMAEIDLAGKWDREWVLSAGLIDIKTHYSETPEDIIERVRTCLETEIQSGWRSPPTAACAASLAT